MEIQRKFSYKAISSVQQFIEQLNNKGFLKGPLGANKKRSLQLIEDTDELVRIPLEGRVAAGRLHEAIQDRQYLDIPRSLLKSGSEYFALTVNGDSMIGDCILEGDVVVIKRQHQAQTGQTVVALVDSEATIKKFVKKKDRIELHPANPAYDIIHVKPESEFKILGILSSVIRRCD